MYVPPPGACASASRWVERSVRAAKLAECWKQLDNLENLLLGPFFCGAMMSLADFAVFPTIVFMEFYMPRVFAWSESALFHDRPRLCAWYTVHMSSLPAASRVRDELVDSMLAKEATGLLKAIIAETKDETYKWKYP
uniref:GST C-terminal domain-containing protein n=2 Tax=Chrysotila carterae TaxID=13221 RepID=A0A7S4B4K9_CHRCT|mmetsp:Transcript_44176/g.96391  ORF Transcript_44176/g.96391 Transcript_44176/m.96391 type:complete len:137 (+) Transcript_44176:237-647(+)